MHLEISMPNDTLLCNGADDILELEIAGGQPPYQIFWENFLDDELSHTVSPTVGTTFEVMVMDNCDYNLMLSLFQKNHSLEHLISYGISEMENLVTKDKLHMNTMG